MRAIILLAALCSSFAQAPDKNDKSKSPIDAETGFLAAQGAQPRFESANKMSAEAELALRQQRVISVPFHARVVTALNRQRRLGTAYESRTGAAKKIG